jgi:hypothetical protein
MLNFIVLSATLSTMIIYCYVECRYAECRYAECRYAVCHYAECHYAECCYAECRGAIYNTGAVFTSICNLRMGPIS